MKALLIAEKPSLRRELEKVYNAHKDEIPYDITFTEQRGHLFTLKTPNELDEEMTTWNWENIPFHPENAGGWKYKLIKEPASKNQNHLSSKERFEKIKNEINSEKYDFIINAGDPDQEGELLIRIVISALKTPLPIKRMWWDNETEQELLKSFKNLRDDEQDPMLVNLLQAGYCRQHSDYRFGMNLSRAASLKLDTRAACGRVKTPILAIVCKRENEIKNFKPQTKYGLKAIYNDNFEGQYFISGGEANEEDDESIRGIVWFDTEAEAQQLASNLSFEGIVESCDKKRVENLPPKLFKLATAQIAAGKMGYSSSETLSIIQSLYDKKYLSYPRTDCEYIAKDQDLRSLLNSVYSIPELREYIDKISDTDIQRVKRTKKWVNDKELADHGHPALTPTSYKPDLSELTSDEIKIYTLICTQFVSIFLPPLVQDKTILIANVDGKTFKSSGSVLINKGYTEIFKSNYNDLLLPSYNKGDKIKVNKYEINSKTTSCPKRFTDAGLIAVCESPHKYLDDPGFKVLKTLKIGTPATRASIIEELIKTDKYLKRTSEGKITHITPTETGMFIYEALKDCDICKVDLTAHWEEELEKVRRGELSPNLLEQGMIEHVNKLVYDIKNSTTIKAIGKKIVGTCPDCGSSILSGPKRFYCSSYHETGCEFGCYKSICDSTLTDDEFIKLFAGEEISKLIKNNSNKWEQALRYNSETRKIEFVKAEVKQSSFTCPKCSNILLKTEKKYYCDCGFTFWKNVGGKEITYPQIEKFFKDYKTDLIEGLKNKAGKTYSAYIVLNDDKTGQSLEFPEAPSHNGTYFCPSCNNSLNWSGIKITCNCGFNLWTKVCGKELSESQVNKLLSTGSTDLLKGLKSKAGKLFDAYLVLNKDKKSTAFKFPE